MYGKARGIEDVSFSVEEGEIFGFIGPNGAGKTNVLEAIHYLCLTKGFISSSDRYVVRKGASHVEAEGVFIEPASGDRPRTGPRD